MTTSQIVAGLKGAASHLVRKQDLASAFGNPGVDVMSSMTLMTLLEQAAIDVLQGALDPSEFTVGAHMEMDHLAPTPQGFTVTASARLQEVKGAKLVFEITAHDGTEQVARATHIRFVVPKQPFLDGVAAKAGGGGS